MGAPPDSNYAGPLGFYPTGGGGGGFGSTYPNPYYNVANQYLPIGIDQQIWWATHFLVRNGFFKTALQRVADYFIPTNLTIEVDDSEAKKEYETAFEALKWKKQLAVLGLDLLSYGNVYSSINQGFKRFLQCPHCKRISDIEKVGKYEFDRGNFKLICRGCRKKGLHKIVDRPSRDVKNIRITSWRPKEIIVQHDEVSGCSRYFWDIPATYSSKVSMKNNQFYSKVVPEIIYKCLFHKGGPRMFEFNNENFLHMSVPCPTNLRTDGRSVPPAIFLFEDFFNLQVLKRYNEAICYEDIVPFRVISMGGNSTNPMANPVLHEDGGNWKAFIDGMIMARRRDPNSYHTCPFPIQYQQLNGEGKNLVPDTMMAQAQQNILSALNIPIELFTMSLQGTQQSGPALRLFENAWIFMPYSYNEALQHWADVIGRVKNLPAAKVSCAPVSLSDDMERKGAAAQLVASNAIAKSELMKIYGYDYEEQLRMRNREQEIEQELQQEEQEKQQIIQANQNSVFNQQAQQGQSPGQAAASPQAGATPGDVMAQAQQIAQQLFPMDGNERRTELQKIQPTNPTLWSLVKTQLAQMKTQAGSQGVQQARQQQAQSGPQQ